MRNQKGCVYHEGKSWFLRYVDNVQQPDGTFKRKLCCKKLSVEYGAQYKTKASVRSFAEEFLAPLNKGTLVPQSTTPVLDFIEKIYLPEHVEKLKPASVKQYKDIFRYHVKGQIPDLTLREFRTFDGQKIMDAISAKKNSLGEPLLGHSSLCHARAFLSGAFKLALRRGYLEGYSGAKHEAGNPMQNVSVPKTEEPEEETHAYSMKEVNAMLLMLEEPARTVVLTAALSGLRKSEIRGLIWANFNGKELNITRSVWNSTVSEPKTKSSKAAIPVVKQLADALEAHRLRAGILAQPDLPIFQAGNGKPLNLDNLVRRVIAPVSNWHGWHAFRRGLATNLHTLGVADRDIQAILRHSDIRLTQKIYIKSVAESQINAMDLLSEKMQSFSDLSVESGKAVN